MTPTSLTLEALSYIYSSNPSANLATITNASTRQLERIRDDLTATLQDLYRLVPGLYRQQMSVSLPAPQVISVSINSGSQVFTTGGQIVDGCKIVIDGDPAFNEVRNEQSAKKLLYPYKGTTGTHNATLYGDAVVLGPTVASVIGNVYLSTGLRLDKAVNRQDLYRAVRVYEDYGRTLRNRTILPTIGIPQKFFTETALKVAETTGHISQLRFRVNPLPQAAVDIALDVQLRASRLTVEDLGTDADESTFALVVPADDQESLLRPLFLERWSRSPWFKDEEARKMIAQDAAAARARLDEYIAQRESSRSISAPI